MEKAKTKQTIKLKAIASSYFAKNHTVILSPAGVIIFRTGLEIALGIIHGETSRVAFKGLLTGLTGTGRGAFNLLNPVNPEPLAKLYEMVVPAARIRA
jgi:hypothetical protein